MLRMSPTVAARLSLTIEGERPSRQRESPQRFCVRKPGHKTAQASRLKRDKDSLFILDLSAKFPSGVRIPNSDHLTGSAVLQHLDFERNQNVSVLQLRLDQLAAMNNRAKPH